jgi:hypothetical protein
MTIDTKDETNFSISKKKNQRSPLLSQNSSQKIPLNVKPDIFWQFQTQNSLTRCKSMYLLFGHSTNQLEACKSFATTAPLFECFRLKPPKPVTDTRTAEA